MCIVRFADGADANRQALGGDDDLQSCTRVRTVRRLEKNVSCAWGDEARHLRASLVTESFHRIEAAGAPGGDVAGGAGDGG